MGRAAGSSRTFNRCSTLGWVGLHPVPKHRQHVTFSWCVELDDVDPLCVRKLSRLVYFRVELEPNLRMPPQDTPDITEVLKKLLSRSTKALERRGTPGR